MKENKNLKHDLRQSLLNILNDFKASRRFLPKQFLKHEIGLVSWIAGLEWQACKELEQVSLDAWYFLSDKYPEAKISHLDPDACLNWVKLVDWARKGQLEQQVSDENAGCVVNIMMGYVLIFDLAQHVIEFYTNKHPNEKASIYIHNAVILKEHGFTKEVHDAYNKLLNTRSIKKVKENFAELRNPENWYRVRTERIYAGFYKALDECLGGNSVEEQIEKAVLGNEDLRYLPHKAFLRRIDEDSKERGFEYRHESVDKAIGNDPGGDDSETTVKDKLESEFSANDLIDTLYKCELISKYTELRDNTDLLSHREKQVLSMRYPLTAPYYTAKETAAELGISEDSVYTYEKRGLAKVRKMLLPIVS